MPSVDETTRVTRLFRTHPSLFHHTDLRPLTLPRSPSPTPVPQRTLFQPETSWTSTSTRAVLDALPTSQKLQMDLSTHTHKALKLARHAGSVPVEHTMADLFEGGDRVVRCTNCQRPVLWTRFSRHLKEGGCGEGEEGRGKAVEKDEELGLVVAPYGERNLEITGKEVKVVSGGGRERRGRKRAGGEDEDWEKELISLGTEGEYMPRGNFRKRRRVAIGEGGRRRGLERKAMQVAKEAGVTWTGPTGKEPLRVLGSKLGPEGGLWGKLMQIAMPVVVGRVPKKRKDDILVVEGGTRVPVAERPPPSLMGGLMYLRGCGLKELACTPLGSMDNPSFVVGRTGAVFHGQTYVAELGTFETDPRAASSIKMPMVANVDKIGTVVGGGEKKNPGGGVRGGGGGGGAGGGGAAAAAGGKKKSVGKGQRGTGGNSGKVSTPRKGGGSRSSGGGTGKGGTTSSQESRVGRGANSAATTGLSGGSNKYALAAQVAGQKKGYRQVATAGGGVGSLSRVGNAHSLPPGSVGDVGVHVPGVKPNSRGGNKGRQGSMPMGTGGGGGVARSTGGARLAKTPSPSQASSRSGDRLAMHRGSPMPAAALYNPALMGGGVNRATGVRGTPVKSQLDFQQVMAQVAGQGGGLLPGAGIGANHVGRVTMPQTSAKGQAMADKLAGQVARAANMRGVHTSQGRVKANSAAPNTQARLAAAAAHKTQARQQVARGVGLRKEELVQRAPDLDAHLRRDAVASGAMSAAGKREKMAAAAHPMAYPKRGDRRNVGMNPAVVQQSQGFYSAALEAASGQGVANHALKSQQQKQQANLAFLRLAHQNQLGAAAAGSAAAAAVTAPNMMQNLHDLRSLQSMGVVPGGSPPNAAARNHANVMNFLQATGLSTGGASTAAMANGGMGGMTGGTMRPSGVTGTGAGGGMMNSDAILQQLLSATGTQGMGRGGMHAGHLTAGMNAGHLTAGMNAGGRGAGAGGMAAGMTPGMTPGMTLGMAQGLPLGRGGGVVPSQNSAIDEIDRALGLKKFDESGGGALGLKKFDESDLLG